MLSKVLFTLAVWSVVALLTLLWLLVGVERPFRPTREHKTLILFDGRFRENYRRNRTHKTRWAVGGLFLALAFLTLLTLSFVMPEQSEP